MIQYRKSSETYTRLGVAVCILLMTMRSDLIIAEGRDKVIRDRYENRIKRGKAKAR